MPDDLSFLDQLEEWLEAQVPANLHELPYRMLETMERVSNELFESLNIHGPPSISIPFPPFGGKEAPPPPPPPPPPMSAFRCGPYAKAGKLVKCHPYAVGAGAALAVTVGLGLGAAVYKYGLVKSIRSRCDRTRGVVEDGMLKEAVVILSPTPMPPILWPLTISLLRAGYIVLVAVPRVEDAEAMERHLAGLEERSALRVLIYDPEDPTTFPPFHRSLLATLTLRFLAPSSGKYAGDPYNPQPAHVPHIHAFVSLYPMNPNPPSQPGALPALPTLLAPNSGGGGSGSGATPKLITLYPSSSVLTMPDSFASQVLTTTHHLLGRNLAVTSNAKVVSVYVGDITLPHTHSMLLGGGKQVSRRQQAKEQLQQASTTRKVSIIRDYVWGSFTALFKTVAYKIGLGSYGRDYACFEQRFLRILKSRHRTQYAVGQYSYLSHFVSRIPVPLLPYALSVLPTLPHPTGPLSSGHGLTASRKATGGKAASAASASSSDHEGGEDLASSIHTTRTTSSRGQPDSESGGSGTGLEGSWVGLEAGN